MHVIHSTDFLISRLDVKAFSWSRISASLSGESHIPNFFHHYPEYHHFLSQPASVPNLNKSSFPWVQSTPYPTLYFGQIPNPLIETDTLSDPFLQWGDAQKTHSASRRLKCVLDSASDYWLVITYFTILSVVLLMYIKLNIYTLQPCWPINCNRYLEQTMKR